MENDIHLCKLVDEKVLLGENLISQLSNFQNIPGVQKIQRQINNEIRFLKNTKEKNLLKINHILCSNLTHYDFLVKILLLQHNINHIDCSFPIKDKPNPLRVDIVCDNGLKWIKVIARNTKSITDAINGRTNYGAKSVLDQANEYLLAASENPCMYKPPKIIFYFSHSLDDELIEDLIEYGIEVKTNLNTVDYDNIMNQRNDEYEDFKNDIKVLNLDVTTMLAYTSQLTNGSNKWIFKQKVLTEHAENERRNPVKPVLDKLFYGKSLISCETAIKSFNDIVDMLAGPKEIERAEELRNKLKIYPDVERIPDDFMKMSLSAKIKPRSLKIFAFGVHMKSVTVTSNEGFIRSAKMQGLNIPVFIHQARALTENKEINAIAFN